MPTYKYEALDTSGNEVKDSVEASNESEAQQKVKAKGYFVTKLTAVAGGPKGKKKKKTGKSRKTFAIGGVKLKMLVTFTRQFSTLQDAGLPVLRSLRILERQMRAADIQSENLTGIGPRHRGGYSYIHVRSEEAGEDEGIAEQEDPHHRLAPVDLERLLVRGPIRDDAREAGSR